MKLSASIFLSNPLRDISLNREDLLQHAQEIAAYHAHSGVWKIKRSLLPRALQSIQFLQAGYREITAYVQNTRDLVPASEWFLDNYYLLKDMKAELHKSLSRKYEKQLPHLAGGKYQGYPRVYALMIEFVEHTDSQMQEDALKEFINAYQSQIPLLSAELWAIPIMLKIVLLENIRRLAEQVLYTQNERQAAEKWLEPFLSSEKGSEHWEEILETTNAPDVYSTAYAERLLRRVRDLGVEGMPILRWLDKVVAKQDTTVEDLAKLEHHRQAMCQVSMGHAITSLRFLSEEDWPRFYEEISLVEKVLESDPSAVFAQMDFASRDIYRHQVEKIARSFGITELIVAKVVLRLTQRASQDAELQQAHVGYYLMGSGRESLERELEKDWGGFRQTWGNVKRILKRHPQTVYFTGVAFTCSILLYAFLSYAAERWQLTLVSNLLIFLAVLFPVSSLAISLVNWVFTSTLTPSFLPKLELREGIPECYRTMVVIPTLLPSVPRVRELLEQLEVYYLANQSSNLHFALLGDFTDASSAEESADEEIILAAKQGIRSLNKKYGDKCFYFFHRDRLWNTAEGVWMGWERKRGKIIEFNRLLRQTELTSYSVQIGELSVLNSVRYVITLDADTQLPRGTAKKLIGTIAHPLQAPRLNEDKSRVVEGYGILQPRISVSILNAAASYFAKISSGKVGVDPYTCAISDIYQDIFGEGIFTGKGIYEVDVFHQVTGDAFPENMILSHDLLEGIYARAGLVTDIELIDGYPGKYHTFVRRLHRWVRGDWQILSWLFKDIPLISKWKIFDNLRRSLETPTQLLLIVLAFTILPGPSWFWVGLVLLEVFFPTILSLLTMVLGEGVTENRVLTENIRDSLIQALLKFIFIPFQAYVVLDAVIRSLIRQLITHRQLLEWETADATERRLELNLKTSWKHMWPTIALVVGFAVAGIFYFPNKVVGYYPLAILWFSSPWIAYKVSLPLNNRIEKLTAPEEVETRSWARRIWAFFEVYVTQEDNWLPPDNVQIDPPNGIAHRTSPTNIGLALLASLSARDLGYLSLSETLARIERTLGTLEGLERWKGHFYNWYDTKSLTPLQPLYVSTVDSGNLVLYLITLKSGLQDILSKPLVDLNLVSGLKDTYDLMLSHWEGNLEANLVAFGQKLNLINLKSELDLITWHNLLETCPKSEFPTTLSKEAAFWYGRLQEMVHFFSEELVQFCPWLEDTEHQANIADSQFDKLLSTPKFVLNLQQYADAYAQIIAHSSTPNSTSNLRLTHAQTKINELHGLATRLQERLHDMAMSTDFRPLYDEKRQLFSIGYRIGEGALDKSYYDLLVSEARQASFIAIAKGDVPQSHWFKLGRTLTKVKGKRSLVSWSGTMFEFLMPLLVMRNYSGTLLDETYKSVVTIQKKYGLKNKIPWGISESGFYAFDAQLNYQYKAFGVPGLGLKRGLIQDLVIAPYSTFLAFMVAPRQALKNTREMTKLGFGGRYGLFEAIDYTPERMSSDKTCRIIQSFMAHHQGMSLLALNNVLRDNWLQQCFHADTMVQATELLLQERTPNVTSLVPKAEEHKNGLDGDLLLVDDGKRFISLSTADTLIPITHFISNGQYSVMLTNAGSGFSRLGKVNITRWREDVTRDPWGMYFYIQNLNSGHVWSASHQPCGDSGEDYKVTYAPDRIEFCRKDGNIRTRTEIVVSPEDSVEIRRISLTNKSSYDRTLEITSYCEVVLTGAKDDLAHPAFGNLFIETEFFHKALLATRRPRGENSQRQWLMHTVVTEGEEIGALQYETDRAKFIGRGRTLAKPHALKPSQPLSNTVGAVLDPIMSLRQRVLIKPGQTVRVSFALGIAERREEVIRLAEKYRDPIAINRTFELAWTHCQMELRHLNLTPALANEAMSLAGHLLYLSPCRQDFAKCIEQNRKGQSDLWPYAISGDLPIVLVHVQSAQHLDLVRQLLTVHEYWRLKGVLADLVILNEDESGYVQTFQDTLRDLISMGHARDLINRSGGIFLLQKKLIPDEDISLICSVARAAFTGEGGSCSVQLRKKGQVLTLTGEFSSDQELKNKLDSQIEVDSGIEARLKNVLKRRVKQTTIEKMNNPIIEGSNLAYANGFGGFAEDTGEYIIELSENKNTPLPWINVIANPMFGFQISESGSGYSWSLNSRENKLTPWSNDPIQDFSGEILYLRDESTGQVWSPTPAPIRETEKYVIKHGQGYTAFQHLSHGLDQELLLFVPIDRPVKIIKLKLHNLTKLKRKLTATQYLEWVLGEARELTAPYIVTEFDEKNNILWAQNNFQEEFVGRFAFLSGYGGAVLGYTGDRGEFIGRNGSIGNPAALKSQSLFNTVGAGLDPCGALQLVITLEPNEEKCVYFFLGETANQEEAITVLRDLQEPEKINATFTDVKNFWQNILGKLVVHTPDKSMDLLLNRWLLYQTIVCRIWARSAFYQSGGAYGFRDQLQDVMSLGIIAPEVAREQIIRHCAHQFVEGDVQHWWHAEKGKGIRTKFSDDLLWLPYVLADYVEHTGDLSILDEQVPFIEADVLPEDVDESYSIPKVSIESGTVYEHCLRAIKKGLRFGEHGLPLIGSGDWNDGFSTVGREGKGESVWLGWFIISTLKNFVKICELRQDHELINNYHQIIKDLEENIELHGWDGEWYRRAYFDNGTPLGSAHNAECQIDAIAQSWSVLSGSAKPSRAKDAMLALEHYLLRKGEGILLLLTPPFDHDHMEPGYIKGYVPGVRENGGQYTHAAIWAVLALTKMGEGDKAAELFNMLNPINHARTESEVNRYKVEPYVMAADVYAINPHVGRGGWTWYTGAAGWMYQTGIEGILGFNLEGNKLTFGPCIPKNWPGYRLEYRYKSTPYNVEVKNPQGKMTGVEKVIYDGKMIEDKIILLEDDGKAHSVEVVM